MGLCRAFPGRLPSEILAEPADVIRMLKIDAYGREDEEEEVVAADEYRQ